MFEPAIIEQGRDLQLGILMFKILCSFSLLQKLNVSFFSLLNGDESV